MAEQLVNMEDNPTLDRGRALMEKWRRAVAGGPGLGFDSVNMLEKHRQRQFGSQGDGYDLPPVSIDDPEVEAVSRAMADLRQRDWKLWQVAMDVHLKGRTLREVKSQRPIFGRFSVAQIGTWSNQATMWIAGRVDE